MSSLHQQIEDLILANKKILLVAHRRPDADTLGSTLAMNFWLKKMGKEIVMACIDKPSEVFSFLPGVDGFVDEVNLSDFDLMIVLDAGASYMTNFHLKYDDFLTALPIINIDHHASNDMYGAVNLVDPDAASATIVLYRMFRDLDVEIDEDMATCLLAGIYGDTGSFMHSNTCPEVFEVASSLMDLGGRVADITKSLFKTKSLDTLRLWGHVLESADLKENGVMMSVLQSADYDNLGTGPEGLSGVIDYLTMVPGTRYAVLINEDRKGNVKGSLRTRLDDVDVSEIAAKFGGGGHPKASGFSLPGKLMEKTNYEVVLDDLSKKSLNF